MAMATPPILGESVSCIFCGPFSSLSADIWLCKWLNLIIKSTEIKEAKKAINKTQLSIFRDDLIKFEYEKEYNNLMLLDQWYMGKTGNIFNSILYDNISEFIQNFEEKKKNKKKTKKGLEKFFEEEITNERTFAYRYPINNNLFFC